MTDRVLRVNQNRSSSCRDGGHLGFLHSGNLNVWRRLEGRDASPCYILSKSVKWFLDFSASIQLSTARWSTVH